MVTIRTQITFETEGDKTFNHWIADDFADTLIEISAVVTSSQDFL